MLLARRLVAAGVRFVSLTYGGWDMHTGIKGGMQGQLPAFDQGFATLVRDLDRSGLLDSTLIMISSEFGRTPKINANISRDHWPQCYTTLLAGGGVKRGFIYGASDKNGMYPAENPVRPDDLAATIFYLLGIDPHTEVRAVGNRPVLISEGKPVMEVMV